MLAPDPCGGAIRTATLPSYGALIVDLGRQHASAVPHNQSTLRAYGSFPEIWRGPHNAVRDRQRKRNAVLPAFGIVAEGRVCNPTILSRYARICPVEHGRRRSEGLRDNRQCQRERCVSTGNSERMAITPIRVIRPSPYHRGLASVHDLLGCLAGSICSIMPRPLLSWSFCRFANASSGSG